MAGVGISFGGYTDMHVFLKETLTGLHEDFDNGPRYFEPWSSDVDDTGAGTPSPNYHTNGRMFQLSTDLTCIAALHGGSLVVLATRGLLATDHVILNHGQVMWTTPELAPPLLTTTPTGGRFSSRQILRASLPYTAGL
ncbi:hypothetical protein TNCV_4230941 [Trichonephila clavipes]|uniref:Uncharacterized protein n=1 Tax=Trichonephila clavipes TaxID=2585209 RepID=A0A8X6SI47_TRICX|nr:hypothetical protein TNCV_4230941 [Trichonephila clavipes]